MSYLEEMEKSKKTKWLIWIGLLTIFAFVLAKPIFTILRNQEQWSTIELVDYRDLFNKNGQKDLQLLSTIESKLRNPESQYIYNNDYNIFVTKIPIPVNFDIKNAVRIRNENSVYKKDEVYFPLKSFNCEILVKSEGISLVNDILLNVRGKIRNVIYRSDDEVFYDFDFETLSLIFNNNQNYLFAESHNSNPPMAIAFKKKNNLLYIVVMTIAREGVQIPQNLLCGLINE